MNVNGQTSYSGVAKALHWLVVALLIAQYVLAWLMPHIGRNTKPDTVINLHFSLGVVILAVMIVRVAWRWTHAEPTPLDGIPPWQIKAHTSSLCLLRSFVAPILGWVNAPWGRFDVSVFGLSPSAPGGDTHARLRLDRQCRLILSWYVMLGLVALHAAATLLHKFVRRDRVLARMLPVWAGGARS